MGLANDRLYWVCHLIPSRGIRVEASNSAHRWNILRVSNILVVHSALGGYVVAVALWRVMPQYSQWFCKSTGIAFEFFHLEFSLSSSP